MASEVLDELMDLYAETADQAIADGVALAEVDNIALAAVLDRHGQMVRESERAAIAKGVQYFFASVDDRLYDDVKILCGRIERGEYSGGAQ